MKLSEEPTEYLILNARTNSEWDECDFAIVNVCGSWKKEQQNRLEIIEPFQKDYNLISMDYYDTAVEFYKDDNAIMPDSAELLNERQWSFIIISQKEINALSLPENRLDCYSLVVKRGGYAIYKCYGKHTGEEFWTADFSIQEILDNATVK
jgi:hypothetical protein